MKRKSKITLTVVIIILILLIGLGVGAYFYLFGQGTYVELEEEPVDLGVTENAATYYPSDSTPVTEGGGDHTACNIKNIVLYGLDNGYDDYTDYPYSRSDAIMILSIDTDCNMIYGTSILRDVQVPIEGHGNKNLNYAYAWGGPVLAIKTLNQTFHLDIEDYVSVNFEQVGSLVDYLGGVTVDLTSAEVSVINSSVDEPKLYGSGEKLLNGEQTVAYCRIRSIDSDSMRVVRQQTVLEAILKKIIQTDSSQYPEMIHNFMAIVETSLTFGDVIDLSSIASADPEPVYNIVPDLEYETEAHGDYDEDNWWMWVYDVEHAAQRVHHIIYGTQYE